MASSYGRGLLERVEFLRGVYILSLVYTALFVVFLFAAALHLPGGEKAKKAVSLWGERLRTNLDRYRTMKPFSLTGRDRVFLVVCFLLYLGLVLSPGNHGCSANGHGAMKPERPWKWKWNSRWI